LGDVIELNLRVNLKKKGPGENLAHVGKEKTKSEQSSRQQTQWGGATVRLRIKDIRPKADQRSNPKGENKTGGEWLLLNERRNPKVREKKRMFVHFLHHRSAKFQNEIVRGREEETARATLRRDPLSIRSRN